MCYRGGGNKHFQMKKKGKKKTPGFFKWCWCSDELCHSSPSPYRPLCFDRHDYFQAFPGTGRVVVAPLAKMILLTWKLCRQKHGRITWTQSQRLTAKIKITLKLFCCHLVVSGYKVVCSFYWASSKYFCPYGFSNPPKRDVLATAKTWMSN